MEEEVSIKNFENIDKALELLKEVLLFENSEKGELKEPMNIKFINIENLKANAWQKRFKNEKSPIINFEERIFNGKPYIIAKIYKCIEETKEFIPKTIVNKTDPLGRMKQIRLKLSKINHLPVLEIVSDKILKLMVEKKIKTKEDFLSIKGLGPAAYRNYGFFFIEELADFNWES